ncbi:MAG: Rpn family recombination-promoting nuclease/putative transposase [Caldilineaceae bacterium]
MAIHNVHDSGYKKLFSNRTIFRQLLETFVDEPWVADLDFSQAETLDKSFIADHYKATESDLIYKVKLQEREVYIYLLLEFQSSVDRFMVVRVAYYTLAFYMDYIANTKPRDEEKGDAPQSDRLKGAKLPAVFPLVVYNGSDKWTAPERLADLVETEPALGDYGVHCRYFKLAENAFTREQLLAIRNIVSTLFLAEAHYDITLLLEEFVALFTHEEDKQAVSLLLNWFHQLVVHGRIQESDYAALEQEYHSIREVRAMLIEALEKEKQQIRQEGREEGEKTARQMIEQILKRRLGTMPASIRERLHHCTLAELNALVNPALDAETWEVFAAALPAHPADV